MSKLKLYILAAVLIAFVAGVFIGLASGRRNPKTAGRSQLARELNLTATQRDQMRTIWSEGLRNARQLQKKERQALKKQRDSAIESLLTESQKAGFQAIAADFEKKSNALGAQYKALFQQAVTETKEILSEKQRLKYEDLIKAYAKNGWKHPRP